MRIEEHNGDEVLVSTIPDGFDIDSYMASLPPDPWDAMDDSDMDDGDMDEDGEPIDMG